MYMSANKLSWLYLYHDNDNDAGVQIRKKRFLLVSQCIAHYIDILYMSCCSAQHAINKHLTNRDLTISVTWCGVRQKLNTAF